MASHSPTFGIVVSINKYPTFKPGARDTALILFVCVFSCFIFSFFDMVGRCPLRSLVTSVPGHFGPKTELDIQFGPWSLRSLVTSDLRSELT